MSAKVAFITGSSRGIGYECAKQLAIAGFDVVIHGRESEKSTERLLACKKEIEQFNVKCEIVQGNIDNLDFINKALTLIKEKFGRLDLLVNNAGVAALRRGDLLEVKEDSYDYCLDINAKSLFFCCQAFANFMLGKASTLGEDYAPKIVNVTSCSAAILSPSRGEYCVSKAAASMVTQLFALRLAETPIKVYEIRPGIIKTDMTSVVEDKYTKLIGEGLVPERRWGLPQDIAKCIVGIAHEYMPYTVGQIINVDGGLNIRNF